MSTTFKPTTPSRRHMSDPSFAEITKFSPEKKLTVILKKTAGRNSYGKITVRHIGGGNKKKYRIIDFKLPSSESSTILTEPRISLSLNMRTAREATFWLLRV